MLVVLQNVVLITGVGQKNLFHNVQKMLRWWGTAELVNFVILISNVLHFVVTNPPGPVQFT
jgi:hypothetical protein